MGILVACCFAEALKGMRAKCRIEMKIDRGGCKMSQAVSHVPLLPVQYSLAVALDDSTRKYQQKDKSWEKI